MDKKIPLEKITAKTLSDLTSYIRSVIARQTDFSPQDKNLKIGLYYLFLFFKMIDLGADLSFLISNEKKNSVSILFRSFIETSIDFFNLDKQGYLDVMELKSFKQQQKLCEAGIKNSANPLLKGLDSNTCKNSLDFYNAEIDKLKNKGVKELQIKEKFELYDSKNGLAVYEILYNLLCQESHVDVAALLSQNMATDEKGVVHINYNPIEDIVLENKTFYLDFSLKMLVDSCDKMKLKYNYFTDEEINKIHSFVE